jgi:hypothetical protein
MKHAESAAAAAAAVGVVGAGAGGDDHGWVESIDPGTGHAFYHHKLKGSSWVKPPEMVQQQAAAAADAATEATTPPQPLRRSSLRTFYDARGIAKTDAELSNSVAVAKQRGLSEEQVMVQLVEKYGLASTGKDQQPQALVDELAQGRMKPPGSDAVGKDEKTEDEFDLDPPDPAPTATASRGRSRTVGSKPAAPSEEDLSWMAPPPAEASGDDDGGLQENCLPGCRGFIKGALHSKGHHARCPNHADNDERSAEIKDNVGLRDDCLRGCRGFLDGTLHAEGHHSRCPNYRAAPNDPENMTMEELQKAIEAMKQDTESIKRNVEQCSDDSSDSDNNGGGEDGGDGESAGGGEGGGKEGAAPRRDSFTKMLMAGPQQGIKIHRRLRSQSTGDQNQLEKEMAGRERKKKNKGKIKKGAKKIGGLKKALLGFGGSFRKKKT